MNIEHDWTKLDALIEEVAASQAEVRERCAAVTLEIMRAGVGVPPAAALLRKVKVGWMISALRAQRKKLTSDLRLARQHEFDLTVARVKDMLPLFAAWSAHEARRGAAEVSRAARRLARLLRLTRRR